MKLKTALIEQLDEVKKSMQNIVLSVYPNGGFNKIFAKASRATAVGTSIIALLSVLMDKTHSIKWLRVVCKALFEYAIFGIEEMQVM